MPMQDEVMSTHTRNSSACIGHCIEQNAVAVLTQLC